MLQLYGRLSPYMLVCIYRSGSALGIWRLASERPRPQIDESMLRPDV